MKYYQSFIIIDVTHSSYEISVFALDSTISAGQT